MSTGQNPRRNLDSSMELEQVYWHFFTKFQDLDVPRSVAEAKISGDEIEELQAWFDVQYGRPRNWCDRTWQEKVEGAHTASSREMFGSLFLILASEIARDHCTEDSLWPVIADRFRTNKTTHSVLFGNDHPTELCKIAMAAGVRKLQLRNLIDRSGKQEYFDTIKLQVGFTFKGALRRLPDWLDGLGSTTSLQMLTGSDVTIDDFNASSPSFQRLWTTLRDFRAGRIRDRCGVAPELITHIATSATLGGTLEDMGRFASTIFSVPQTSVEVIEGEKAPLHFDVEEAQDFPVPVAAMLAGHSNLDIVTLGADGKFLPPNQQGVRKVTDALASGVTAEAITATSNASNDVLAPFLKCLLEQMPIVRQLAKLIRSRELWSLDALASELWSHSDATTQDATALLLRLAASARSSDELAPIIPHRLHCLVRAPEGLSVCLNSDCTAPLSARQQNIGALQASQDRCAYCDSITLPVLRCKACGTWAMGGYENIDSGEMESGLLAEIPQRRYYLVASSDGLQLSTVTVNPLTGECFGQQNGTTLYRVPCPEHGTACNDPSKCIQQECPHCKTNWSAPDSDSDEDDFSSNIQPLRGGERLAVGVTAETLLYGMPEYPDENREWKPGKGRRLLCFSDSRREAARLGPLLSRQHEIQLIRAAIANTVQTWCSSPLTA